MNPLAYKAHPLLLQMISLLENPSENEPVVFLKVAAIILFAATLNAAGIRPLIHRGEEFTITPLKAYLLALPASLLYTPIMLTLLQDIVHQAFQIQDRWFLLFALLICSQILTALYAFGIRNPRTRNPIGIDSGLGISLLTLLISMGVSLILLGISAIHPIF